MPKKHSDLIPIETNRQLGRSLKEDLEILGKPSLKQAIQTQLLKEAKTSGQKVAAGILAKHLVMAACGETVLRWHPELEDEKNLPRGGRGMRAGFIQLERELKRKRESVARWVQRFRAVKIAGGGAAYSAQKAPQIIEQYEKALLRDELVETPPLPKGKYRILYADPPWAYSIGRQHTWEEQGQDTTLADHYPSMSLDQLCALSIRELAGNNAVLFLWNTVPLLEAALAVVEAWGFVYKSEMIWDKIKHNVGYWFSVRHERLWVCSRGQCLPDNRKLYDSVQSIERGEHSQKPAQFRAIIDDLYPPRKDQVDRIELFAREELPSHWHGWGAEAAAS